MQENAIAKASQERLKQAFESRSEKPETLAREMLRQGDVQVTDILSWIADQEEAANAEFNLALLEELGDIKIAVNEAYAKLKSGLEQAERSSRAVTEKTDSRLGSETSESEATQENPTEMADDAFADALAGISSQTGFDFSSLEKMCAAAKQKPERGRELQQAIQEKVGIKYAKLIVENKEYRDGLNKLKESLTGKLDEDGPEFLTDKNIENLVAIQEILGPNARQYAETLNLKRQAPGLKHNSQGSALRLGVLKFDKETGEIIDSRIDVNMGYLDDEGDDALISRKFFSTLEKAPDGQMKRRKSIYHELIKLPDSIKKNGLAARLTRESLKLYDESGFDDVTLHANIDGGAYTWASYGYGWDEDTMALMALKNKTGMEAVRKFNEKNFVDKLKEKNPNITQKEISTQVKREKERLTENSKMDAVRQFAALGQEQKLQLLAEKVRGIAKDNMDQFLDAAKEAGLMNEEQRYAVGDIRDLIVGGMDFDEAAKQSDFDTAAVDGKLLSVIKDYMSTVGKPEFVTPQTLAAIGKNGPMLRRGKSDRWYTPEAFQAALASGEDEEPESMRADYHAGKIGFLNGSWYGKIELKNEGRQAGKNRQLLEKKINQSV